MFERIKSNKAYYGFLLGDAVYLSAVSVATLSLVNLPVALVATGLNLAGNAIGGIAFGPRAPTVEEKSMMASFAAAAAQEKQKLRRRTRAKNNAKGILQYYRSTFGNPHFVVSTSAAGAGTNLFFQAALGVGSIVTTHSLPLLGAVTGIAATGGIAACAVVGALGLSLIFFGNIEKWRVISNLFTAQLRKGAAHLLTKENFLHSLAAKLHMTAFVNNKWTKRGVKALMMAASIESSAFVLTAAPTVIAGHIHAAFAGKKSISKVVLPIAAAMWWIKAPVWDLWSNGKIIASNVFRKGGSKGKNVKQAVKDVAETFQPAPPGAAEVAVLEKIEKFEETAEKKQAKQSTTPKAALTDAFNTKTKESDATNDNTVPKPSARRPAHRNG